MSTQSSRGPFPVRHATGSAGVFARADVLFALEWSASAPGIGGWDVMVDDERETRLLSVVPPGATAPSFFIVRDGGEVIVHWQPTGRAGEAMEVGRWSNLRAAVLGLCPLNEDRTEAINESMEILYPRSLRNRPQPKL